MWNRQWLFTGMEKCAVIHWDRAQPGEIVRSRKSEAQPPCLLPADAGEPGCPLRNTLQRGASASPAHPLRIFHRHLLCCVVCKPSCRHGGRPVQVLSWGILQQEREGEERAVRPGSAAGTLSPLGALPCAGLLPEMSPSSAAPPL